MTKTPILIATAGAVLIGGLQMQAQQGPKAAASQPISLSPEEIAARIPEVERQIEEREIRASELTQDIVQLDERIEGRIDRILKQLESMKDSKESGTRVVRMKEDAIEGLRETIRLYDSKRRELKLEAYSQDPSIDRDTLFSAMDKYDARIEKRVDQILELAQTFAAHKDLPKYKYSRSSGWRGWSWETTRNNPEYQQNRKQTIHTDQTRQELIDALDKSIEGLDRRNREIGEIMKKEITSQYRELLQHELDQNNNLIVMREEQIGLMLNPPEESGTTTSTNSAMKVGHWIEDLVDDIQADMDEMFADINELKQEKEALTYLRERLKVAKEEAAAAGIKVE